MDDDPSCPVSISHVRLQEAPLRVVAILHLSAAPPLVAEKPPGVVILRRIHHLPIAQHGCDQPPAVQLPGFQPLPRFALRGLEPYGRQALRLATYCPQRDFNSLSIFRPGILDFAHPCHSGRAPLEPFCPFPVPFALAAPFVRGICSPSSPAAGVIVKRESLADNTLAVYSDFGTTTVLVLHGNEIPGRFLQVSEIHLELVQRDAVRTATVNELRRQAQRGCLKLH